MNLTSIARLIFAHRVREVESWKGRELPLPEQLLVNMLRHAEHTVFGRANGFSDILASQGSAASHRDAAGIATRFASTVPLRSYEDFRADVMRMVEGEKDVLWPGVCNHFAQSSGTTGGRSKYLPITEEGLQHNHYKGAS